MSADSLNFYKLVRFKENIAKWLENSPDLQHFFEFDDAKVRIIWYAEDLRVSVTISYKKTKKWSTYNNLKKDSDFYVMKKIQKSVAIWGKQIFKANKKENS